MFEHAKRTIVAISASTIALTGVACGGDDARDPGLEEGATLGEEGAGFEDIYRDPERYRREEVVVSGIVVDRVDDHMIRINTAGGIDGGLIVHYAESRERLEVGDDVQVQGTVIDLESDQWPIDDETDSKSAHVFPTEDEYAIVASEVTKLSEVPL